MGIFGALSTAVSGLRAQSFALENISGNIANSQTSGYKRIESDFVDLIPDAPVSRVKPGAVLAQSRSTNTVQGDVKNSSIGTYLALSGSGFFVVDEKIGETSGEAVFGSTEYYTRRGDFEVDKSGYLVNGAGYYLKGYEIDTSTGTVSGSNPEVIQVSNAFLPAEATTRIDYRLNLPESPEPAAYDSSIANSELLNAADFVTTPADITATATGATLVGGNAANTVMASGESLTINVNGTEVIFDFYDSVLDGAYAGANVGIDITAGIDIDTALAAVQTGLRANGGTSATDATVALNGGVVEITLGTNTTASFSIVDGTTGLGLTDGDYDPTDSSIGVDVDTISANDSDTFVEQSLSGGAVTAYAENGSPVNVQLRWAKVDSRDRGGVDEWHLYYLSDGDATGSQTMWTRVNQDYIFNAAGSLSPDVTSVTINGLTINGVNLGNVTVRHNSGGITQFADEAGSTSISALNQNGYGAGEFISVAINDSGRVVASYTNGEQIEIAQVITAEFNAPNQLKRLDGGIFSATAESGEAIIDGDGGNILAAALESSNTDISDEFTKLIVTQQAYTASTRIITTSDEMLQEAVNMIR